jgi:hypothetical protein
MDTNSHLRSKTMNTRNSKATLTYPYTFKFEFDLQSEGEIRKSFQARFQAAFKKQMKCQLEALKKVMNCAFEE